MNKQTLLFSDATEATEEKYSKKIEAPVYEPTHAKPHLLTLCDPSKTKAMIKVIDDANIPEEEKVFLRLAATRHTVFHYERIADYYAHSGPEMQAAMELLALVIIDFNSAIERGFVKLCADIRGQYMEEYNDNSATT